MVPDCCVSSPWNFPLITISGWVWNRNMNVWNFKQNHTSRFRLQTELLGHCPYWLYCKNLLQADSATICSSQTEILPPPKNKFAFFCFLDFFSKIIEFNDLKAKNVHQPKTIESWTILNIFELFFCSISMYVKFFGHIFFSLYGQSRVFWLFCFENQSIKKRFFLSAQSAVNEW